MKSAGRLCRKEPNVEFLAIKVLRVAEPNTGRQIKSDNPFDPEQIADFVATQFLGHRALTPEETLATLHRFGTAFSYVDRKHSANRLR